MTRGLRRLRYLGMDRDNYTRFKHLTANGRSWNYDVSEAGFRYHMSDIHAAIGLAQLPYPGGGQSPAGGGRRPVSGRVGGRAGDRVARRGRRIGRPATSCSACSATGGTRRWRSSPPHQVGASVHFRRNDEFPMFEKQDLPNAASFCSRVDDAANACGTDGGRGGVRDSTDAGGLRWRSRWFCSGRIGWRRSCSISSRRFRDMR